MSQRTPLKNLKLWFSFLKASFIADLEYRMNFLTRIITEIFWYAAQVITFETLYLHTTRIGDWNVQQARVFLGLLFVVDSLYMILISENLDRLSEKVRKGDLDLLLAKPVNSQFMLSFQRVATAQTLNLVMACAWLIWACSSLNNFDGWQALHLIILIPCSLICIYAFRFAFASTAVILTRSENLQYIWYQFYKLGTRPDSIYFPWLKAILYSVFPVAFVASIPARALFGQLDPLVYVWVVFWSLSCLWISGWIWRTVLRHYTSASS